MTATYRVKFIGGPADGQNDTATNPHDDRPPFALFAPWPEPPLSAAPPEPEEPVAPLRVAEYRRPFSVSSDGWWRYTYREVPA